MVQTTDRDELIARRESIVVLVYYLAYLLYLFVRLESEFLHWIGLVLLPAAILLALRRSSDRRAAAFLASVGLRRDSLSSGVAWAIAVGLTISVLQIFVSRRAGEILSLFSSGRAWFLFPLTFALMLATAGFTEEFFFRGVLQKRLQFLLRSRWLGVIAASLLFGLYHLPYAYANPNWPSAGDWSAAWSAALGQGVPGGLVLGAIYALSRNNLLASVVAHSLINALPAMTMIRFQGP